MNRLHILTENELNKLLILDKNILELTLCKDMGLTPKEIAKRRNKGSYIIALYEKSALWKMIKNDKTKNF